jgi:hypothetical protein
MSESDIRGFLFFRSRISLRSCGLRISYTTHLLHAATASSCAGLSRASMSYFLRGGPKTWMAGSSPAMTVQMSQEETVKPSRRECRNVRLICGDYTCVLALFAHKAAGAARHPAFPAPSNCWGRCSTELGRASSAARPCKLAVSGAKRQRAHDNGRNGTLRHALGISPTARRQAGRPGSRRSASLRRGRARATTGHPDRRSAPAAPAALPAPWQAMSRPCNRS